MKCPKCKADNPRGATSCRACKTRLTSPRKSSGSRGSASADTGEQLPRGLLLAGRYEIIESLGKGGLGQVYRVVDRELDEEVALKVLHPRIASDRRTLSRFRNELKISRKISHKNVCRVFHFGKEGAVRYITMEYVPGESLMSLIERIGKLPEEKAIAIAMQVCEGLAEAHAIGVVHRDVKPHNIMIDRTGNVRIMDFGIARSIDTEGQTETGMIVGTPDYMSPEQVDGKEADRRSDIYSLGIALYEMVTGEIPFHGENTIDAALRHKTERPRHPREINAQVSEDLSRIILKCLEKDRALRYQDARQLHAALAALVPADATGQVALPRYESDTIPRPQASWKHSIAVLPFADLSPQKDQEFFCDGIAEELINALTRIEDTRTVARTSSFLFKGEKLDIRDIGRRLNVEAVLEGSVRKAGRRLRITAQLINVVDGFHLWSEQYDRDTDDVFAIQDEVAVAIASRIRGEILGGEKARIVKHHTDDPEAYTLYLKGRHFWHKRTQEGFRKSMECFQEALKRDPTCAPAYAGLADDYTGMGFWGLRRPAEAYPKARELVEKALAIDETLAEAHCSLGFIRTFFDWDWAEAEAAYRRALDLNPNMAQAHTWLAMLLSCVGRTDESIEEAKTGQRLDPLSIEISTVVGLNFYVKRRYDEAIAQCRKAMELDPGYFLSYWILGFSYIAKGMTQEAVLSWRKALELSEGSGLMLGSLGGAYALSGRREEALKILDRLVEMEKEIYVSPLQKFMIHLCLGNRGEAMDHLEAAYRDRASELVFLKAVVLTESLRPDPRFTALLKKMGL
jgi:serine/threonine protein kinase/tetratricopeptide (TPR) repeat protein